MRFVGIEVAAERDVVAAGDEAAAVAVKPTPFTEDAEGYQKLRGRLGAATDTLVALEATGHCWKNLFAALVADGFAVAVLNPLRTRRFASEDLQRTRTDAIDALGIARLAAQKRPRPTRLPDQATEELRELVRFRDRLVQDFGDRVRQLHRLVDLGFPEFSRYVCDLGSELATALLHEYPTATAFHGVSPRRLAGLRYDGRHKVGDELAAALLEAAPRSVSRHHGEIYRIEVRYTCEDLTLLRRRRRDLAHDIERLLDTHEVGRLLTTIPGIGPQTSARLVATFGDFTSFPSGASLASYVGAIPAIRQSGKRTSMRASLTPLGAASLRAKLWMPVLSAVRANPWLRAYYEGLIARGKLPKVALVAAMRKLLHAVYSVAIHRHRQPRTREGPVGLAQRAISTQYGIAGRCRPSEAGCRNHGTTRGWRMLRPLTPFAYPASSRWPTVTVRLLQSAWQFSRKEFRSSPGNRAPFTRAPEPDDAPA